MHLLTLTLAERQELDWLSSRFHLGLAILNIITANSTENPLTLGIVWNTPKTLSFEFNNRDMGHLSNYLNLDRHTMETYAPNLMANLNRVVWDYHTQ